MFRMTTHGTADLARKLDALQRVAERRVIVRALRSGAQPMKRDAAAHAPREPGQPDMADHIDIKDLRANEGRPQPTVAVGLPKRFFYDYFQEYGTVHHSAQPFWRPAFDVNVPASIGVVVDELWSEIRARLGTGSARMASDTSGNRNVL